MCVSDRHHHCPLQTCSNKPPRSRHNNYSTGNQGSAVSSEQRGRLGWLLMARAVNKRGGASRGHRLLFYWTFPRNVYSCYAEVTDAPLMFDINAGKALQRNSTHPGYEAFSEHPEPWFCSRFLPGARSQFKQYVHKCTALHVVAPARSHCRLITKRRSVTARAVLSRRRR